MTCADEVGNLELECAVETLVATGKEVSRCITAIESEVMRAARAKTVCLGRGRADRPRLGLWRRARAHAPL